MNLRHPAALASVDWYLLTPLGEAKGNPSLVAPLRYWQIYGSFDTAKECEAEKDKLTDKLMPAFQQAKTAKEKEKVFLWLTSPKCFASDDPRLKEK